MDRRQFLTLSGAALLAPFVTLEKLTPEEEQKLDERRQALVLDQSDPSIDVRTDPDAPRRYAVTRFRDLKPRDLFQVREADNSIYRDKDDCEFWECLEDPVCVKLDSGEITWAVHIRPWIPPRVQKWTMDNPDGTMSEISIQFTTTVLGADTGLLDVKKG